MKKNKNRFVRLLAALAVAALVFGSAAALAAGVISIFAARNVNPPILQNGEENNDALSGH